MLALSRAQAERVTRRVAVPILSLLWAGVVAAQQVYVPPDLESWVPWVLDGKEFRACPFMFNRPAGERGEHLCAWPGALDLDVQPDGVRFTQGWRVYGEAWAPLPGNGQLWPENVEDDGEPVRVVTRDGRPSVWLAPGSHRITGRIAWPRIPGELPLPRETGLVRLRVAGEAIARPRRDADRLWLAERDLEQAAEDALELRVYRKLADGIPLTLSTSIELEISGSSREELLGRALPAGWVPLALESALPARIEPDGRLRIQVRPGRWAVMLEARAQDLPADVAFAPGGEGAWATREVWSYASAERLRVTQIEGGTPVDPAQAGVPDPWRRLPAFELAAGEPLRILERTRGLAPQLENRLQLAREMWRDFDRTGFTVLDRIEGRMETGWRLDMQAPYVLGGARSKGEHLLVTRGESPGLTGVELRDVELSLETIGRLEAASALPATGWQQRFDGARVSLYLPPGERLLAAFGADSAPTAWLTRWSLWDYFLVLLIALAVGRLTDWRWGVLALVAIILIYREPGAPQWSWLALLAGIALAQHAPEGRLRRWVRQYRNLAFLALLLIAVPFAALQLRAAVYPQLEPRLAFSVAGLRQAARTADAVYPAAEPAAPRPMPSEEVSDQAGPQALLKESLVGGLGTPGREAVVVTGGRIGLSDLFEMAGTLVQTGAPVPDWRWNAYPITWTGPVSPRDELRLVVLGRGPYRLVRVLGVLLLGALLWRLARESFGRLRLPSPSAGQGAAWMSGALVLIALAPSGPLLADTPDPALLRELEERMTRSPECVPRCAEIESARVRVGPGELTMGLAIHALEHVAVPLPGAIDSWEPASVRLDGRAVDWLYRDPQQALWLRLDPGIHRVELAGPLPPLESLRVPFPEAPHRVGVSAEGWRYSGVTDGGQLLGGALQLERLPEPGTAPAGELEAREIAPFVRVTRSIHLDLDWTLSTRVDRIAPPRGPFSLEIPLLPGEAVTTAGIEVRDGQVAAGFTEGQVRVQWQSRLEPGPKLQLVAGAAGLPYREIWQTIPGPLWRVSHGGTPLVAAAQGGAFWTPEFHPRPGESLTLEVSRPPSIDGDTLTIDRALLAASIGKRVSESRLELHYRSTRGGQHVLELPEQANVVQVLVDGEALANRPREGELSLPVRPGAHDWLIHWQDETALAWRARTPAVDLRAPAGNVSLALSLPQDRWVLGTRGPAVGPAVLLWSELVVFLALAPLLARIPGTPLRSWHWLLLGIGFSTFSWTMLALLAAWLAALGWRARARMPESRLGYNALQTALAALTVVTLIALLAIIPQALLGRPDMHIQGNGSSAFQLAWFVDRVQEALPRGGAVSLPLWMYKAAILLWSLWLAFALLRWLPWAWKAWTRNGSWRGRVHPGAEPQPMGDGVSTS